MNEFALVRLVASRYRELQGLRTIADGGALIVMGAGLYAMWMYPRTATGAYFALFVFALCGYGWFWWKWTRNRGEIDAFYSSQCGRIPVKSWGPPVVITTWLALECGPICLDLGIAKWVSVAVFAVLLAARPAWYVIRDWPYRILWLLPASAGVFAAASFASVVNREQASLWWGEFSLVIGASMLVAGWFDHRRLMKTLRPSEATANATSDL
jgi:hypothetical protein